MPAEDLSPTDDARRRSLAPAVRALALDAMGLAVLEALESAGVEAILLKGPALEYWLYEGHERRYADIDVLVGPDSFAAARDVVRKSGFTKHHLYVDRP